MVADEVTIIPVIDELLVPAETEIPENLLSLKVSTALVVGLPELFIQMN
jgi:hypothetical protein